MPTSSRQPLALVAALVARVSIPHEVNARMGCERGRTIARGYLQNLS